MSNRIIYNVEYNIPRVNVAFSGRQNRSMDGVLRITPGMTEVMEFVFGNHDGLPINLANFKIKLVFWNIHTLDEDVRSNMGMSKIVFAKQVDIIKPYEGKVIITLDDADTVLISSVAASAIRWNLFAINDDKQVFPMEVSRTGGRSGSVEFDTSAGIPSSELIRTA